MQYQIKQLAKLAGVSVRTLHYYDKIGLFKPSGTLDNGYRYYKKDKLLRLQQILFYRELDFPLDKIKELIDAPNFNMKKALEEHRLLIKQKQSRLNKLIKTIDKTIKYMDKQATMSDEELYDPFRDEDVKQYQAEVKLRWGNTKAYQQSMRRVSKMTKKEMEKMKKDGKALTQKIADNMEKGPSDKNIQTLIAEHYKGIQFFYTCTLEMYKCLGEMYVKDSRFAAYYNKFKPDLAVFMRDAINIYCQKHKD